MGLTGGEIVAEYLVREGIPYVVGIPGHGCLGLVDAFRKYKDKLSLIQVRHEQSAAHLADGYYRASSKPLAVFTSIGPGAINIAIGVATSYVDSTAMLVIIGGTHTYMKGRGVLQEIERKRWADNLQVFEPITKSCWRVESLETLPFALERAFSHMLTGRPGPVVIELPMDIQAKAGDFNLDKVQSRRAEGMSNPDPLLIEKAARLLYSARRPVILSGGGVIASRATDGLRQLAEFLGAPVVTTMMGKGSFPEDHPLYGWHAGSKGTTCGNKLTSTADIILAIGCRFADETCSSYRPDVSFSIPPTKLIHIDVDPNEIGKNYPVEVGIISDARSALNSIISALKELGPAKEYMGSSYFKEIQDLKAEWFNTLSQFRNNYNGNKIIISKFLELLRLVLPKEAIVVTSSGNAQAQVFQEVPFYEPRTFISSGGFSTMGFSFPASLGVKLAQPNKPVVAIVGDGDFLMTIQELVTAAQYNIPVITIVVNNFSWGSIADLQASVYGREYVYGTKFTQNDGSICSLDFARIANAFGVKGERVEKLELVEDAIKRAVLTDSPTVIDVIVEDTYPYSGGVSGNGWWDVPIPEYLK